MNTPDDARICPPARHRRPGPRARSVVQAMLVGGLLCGAAAGASAQSAADAAQRTQAQQAEAVLQQRLDRERALQRERGERVGGASTETPPAKPGRAAPGGACHPVERIEVTGHASLSTAELMERLEPLRGECVGAAQIEAMLAALTQAYVSRGLVAARAYLPSQDLRRGTLTLQVVEGRVTRIDVRDGGNGSVSPANIFPGAVGAPVQLRDLEQGIDQINRLPSNRATLDLEPGARPGETVVAVKNQPSKRHRITLSLDNMGSPASGRNQLGVNVAYDHLLGFNDGWSFTHRESVGVARDRQHGVIDALDVSVPFGRQTVLLGVSRLGYVTEITTPGGVKLIADGDTTSGLGRLDRVLYRDDQHRVAAAGTLQVKDSRNRLAGQALEVSSRRLAVFDLDLSADLPLGPGRLRVTGGWSRGLPWFGAMHDVDGLPDWAPRAQFTKLRAQAQWQRPFTVGHGGTKATFTSQWTAQHSSRPLYGSEQMSIGGYWSVRGFLRQSLSGDSGWFARHELALMPQWTLHGEDVATRLYAAVDAGRVRNVAPNVPQGGLAGAAIGVQLRWKGVNFDAARTQALKRSEGMPKEPGQTWLLVSTTF